MAGLPGGTASGLDDELTNDLVEERRRRRRARTRENPDPAANPETGADQPPAEEPPKPTPPTPAPPAPSLPGLGSYNSGWNDEKLADPTKSSTAKYKIGRVLDAAMKRGVAASPEALAALLPELNALGIGTFGIAGGRGDKVTYKGDDEILRQALNGEIDLLTSGNQWWWGFDGGQAATSTPTGAAPSSAMPLPRPASTPAAPAPTPWHSSSSQLPGLETMLSSMLTEGGTTRPPATGRIPSSFPTIPGPIVEEPIGFGPIDYPTTPGPMIDDPATPPSTIDTSGYTPQQALEAGLAWVPRDHPAFGQPGYVGSKIQGQGGGGETPQPPIDPNDPYAPLPLPDPPDPNDNSVEGLMKRMLYEQAVARNRDLAMKKQVHGTITRRIGEAEKPVDPNDPILSAQSRSYRIAQEKALARGREAMADRATASGTTTGNLDAALQSSYENLGSDTAAHDSALMGQRYAQKLAELQSMLQLGAGILSDSEQMQLQSSISQLKARLDDLRMKSDIDLSGRDLDLRRYIADRGFDIDDRHFYDTLAYNIGSNQGNLDQWLMEMLLGR